MDIKKTYANELTYIEALLKRSRENIIAQGLTTSYGYGNSHRDEINQELEAYTILIDTYIKIANEIQGKQ